MSTIETSWLTPLLHAIEPPEYEEDVRVQRMKRTWVSADGKAKSLPSLLDKGEPKPFVPIHVYATVDGVRRPYRSIGAACTALKLYLAGSRIEKLREKVVCEGMVTIRCGEREFLFELRD
ncbi:hypothetical protein IAG25_25455 [Caballeronia sp. EK]|uniref:hypothetical protein n=1 Tax=Caballeronia sp. EK TaxID=2767469 RepID=UPI0016556C73|nr:hypothetical protein [Caballeronia sp. EK]MBC8640182.1 hypothetical protein [Caballeronia sp. EK]